MDGRRESRITFSDRMDNRIVVGFDDGKTAYYPAALLHPTLPQAQTMLLTLKLATRPKASKGLISDLRMGRLTGQRPLQAAS